MTNDNDIITHKGHEYCGFKWEYWKLKAKNILALTGTRSTATIDGKSINEHRNALIMDFLDENIFLTQPELISKLKEFFMVNYDVSIYIYLPGKRKIHLMGVEIDKYSVKNHAKNVVYYLKKNKGIIKKEIHKIRFKTLKENIYNLEQKTNILKKELEKVM